jgi:hypothetical protein
VRRRLARAVLQAIVLNLRPGFSHDIEATPDDLNLSISRFFVTFVLFQPPSAAIGRWLGAKYWITIMMVSYSGQEMRHH